MIFDWTPRGTPASAHASAYMRTTSWRIWGRSVSVGAPREPHPLDAPRELHLEVRAGSVEAGHAGSHRFGVAAQRAADEEAVVGVVLVHVAAHGGDHLGAEGHGQAAFALTASPRSDSTSMFSW